jgi:hypothetical protein
VTWQTLVTVAVVLFNMTAQVRHSRAFRTALEKALSTNRQLTGKLIGDIVKAAPVVAKEEPVIEADIAEIVETVSHAPAGSHG